MSTNKSILHMLTSLGIETIPDALFLLSTGQKVFTVQMSRQTEKVNEETAFLKGRGFSLSHGNLVQEPDVLLIRPGQVVGKSDVVLVTKLDKQTGVMHAIPHKVTRDRKGNIIDLVDEGNIVEVLGTFLPAFILGMRTATFSESEAQVQFKREMKRLGNEMLRKMREQR